MRDRFHDLEEVRKHKIALYAERDRPRQILRTRLDQIGDPAFRRELIGDAFGDMLRAWKPMQHLGKLFGGSQGITRTALGTVLGAKARTPMGRTLVAIASIVLPAFANRWPMDSEARSKLQHELGVSWHRLKEYVNERRKAHNDRTTE